MKTVVRAARMLVALAVLGVIAAGALRAGETIPPAPAYHFNDYAGIVAPGTAQALERDLTQFERETSNQIVVAIYPRMESDSSVEDYTVRVAQAWGAGTKLKSNGTVLFVFQESHDLRIQVGYGLEGTLTDALCKRIVEEQIVPRFRAGDFSGGMDAGTRAIMAATRGEYKGSGQLVGARRSGNRGLGWPGLLFVIGIMVVSAVLSRRRNTVYNGYGRRGLWLGGPGGWGGGGGGGGGTFSGGGGSFGGGGAGGKW